MLLGSDTTNLLSNFVIPLAIVNGIKVGLSNIPIYHKKVRKKSSNIVKGYKTRFVEWIIR
ncbi:hypothetical protein FB550_102406 [Neobacillus bataviensis]|uniref:Uncharacterized protein n=1 Tax=Neobacillus bataviensis TaxID=220685 RepID=A0A561DSQ4_9BACI|nr:hypothetical protein FB550_102406 [Neobacillus bataviensis]